MPFLPLAKGAASIDAKEAEEIGVQGRFQERVFSPRLTGRSGGFGSPVVADGVI